MECPINSDANRMNIVAWEVFCYKPVLMELLGWEVFPPAL